MALKYYDSTDSNSIVIRAQSFGSYSAQFVNCNLILFLILSSCNCVIGASPRLLFINCPKTETTAKRVMSAPSVSTPYSECASLPRFFLVMHIHTRIYIQTHQIRLEMFFSFRFTSWHENPLLELLTSHTRLEGEVIFTKSEEAPWPGLPGAHSQVLCQLVVCFEITWSLPLNEKDASVGLPRGRHASEFEKRWLDFWGRCESPLVEHSQLPAPGLVLGCSDARGPIELLLFWQWISRLSTQEFQRREKSAFNFSPLQLLQTWW